jgi:hypothetical protein
MREEIELPENLGPIEMTDQEKDELITRCVKDAGRILLVGFIACAVPNYISGNFEDEEGNQYELLIRKRSKPAAFA